MTPAHPFSPARAAADLLAHPVSPVSMAAAAATLWTHPVLLALANANLPSPLLVGRLSDVLSFCALLFMLLRTLRYISARAAGAAGPAPATVLLKFWAVAGALHFCANVLHLYVYPMQAGWLAHCVRALLFLPLCFDTDSGARVRLPVAVRAFDSLLKPFYDERAHEIDAAIADVVQHAATANEALSQLARVVLERLAVGGIPAVLRLPAELMATAVQQQQASAQSGGQPGQQQPEQQQQQQQQRDRANAAEADLDVRDDGRRVALLPQPPPDNARAAARFRAGGPDVRAAVARRAALPPAVERVVDATVEDMPRPAFDTSRAMRARFRERYQRRAAKAALR